MLVWEGWQMGGNVTWGCLHARLFDGAECIDCTLVTMSDDHRMQCSVHAS